VSRAAVTRRAPGRRTQRERRDETRAKLLDATIASLHDVGYAATTTRRVAELAGVSMGAMTHHFPYRLDLIAAAVERLSEQHIASLAARLDALPPDPRERLRTMLDAIWHAFAGLPFDVFIKLWIAAAEDAELYRRLIPTEQLLSDALARFVEDVTGERARDRWLLALNLMRGTALAWLYEPRAHRRHDRRPALRPEVERMLLGA
jgi:AcrR family transcriptional regulator